MGLFSFLFVRRGFLFFSLVLMVLAGGLYASYSAGQKTANQAWQLKWLARDKTEAEALSRYQQEMINLEHQRAISLSEVNDNAQQKINEAYADAARAQSAADRLQHTLVGLRRQLADSETGRLAGVARERQPTASAALLLADVLSRADKRAGELAAYADHAQIAGATCERIYRTQRALK